MADTTVDGIANSARVNATTHRKIMPYDVRKQGNKFMIVRKPYPGDKIREARVVAGNKTKLSKERAVAAMRGRYVVESGTKMRSA